MTECKHGLKTGCSYCHVTRTSAPSPGRKTRGTPSSRLSDKMNDRMTALKRRLRALRGDPPPGP